MIYLDNAATTLRKPPQVIDAVVAAMGSFGNSARGTHEEALAASRVIYDTRCKLAALFGCKRPDHVAFTCNSTEALNIAIHGCIHAGEHVISTDLEHNSVLRPLYRLERENNVKLSFVPADRQGNIDYADFERLLRPDTRAVVCTHASNLTGNVLDLARIGQFAHAHRLLFLVDASQSAGVLPIDMEKMHIDVLCFTGHKSLMGPQGTGGLCVREGVDINPWKVGGTGVQTYLHEQPEQMPTRLEAGTLNGHGIAGLNAALDFLQETGVEAIHAHEMALLRRFVAGVKKIPGVTMDDIYTGNGVSELINLSMQALLNDGDEILIPAPDYPLWTATATLAGGKVVHYICDEESDWNPDIADIRSKITDKTKAIVIINPNNPTGALYSKEILEEIVKVAEEFGLIIFSDEIYDRLVMDGLKHISIASIAPKNVFCVTFSGLSKSHMIAGFRVGWMVLSGNKKAAAGYIEGIKMLSNMRLCSNVPAQSIIQTALGGYQSVEEYLQPGGRIYEQREVIYKLLNDIPGVSAKKPKAAFYIFPKLDVEKFNIYDDEKFALDLLREKRILIVHGGGFNWGQPDHFRVVYLPRVADLEKATKKLGEFLDGYHQK